MHLSTVRNGWKQDFLWQWKKSREKGTVGGGAAGRSEKKLVRGSNRKDEKYGGRTIGKILIEVEV